MCFHVVMMSWGYFLVKPVCSSCSHGVASVTPHGFSMVYKYVLLLALRIFLGHSMVEEMCTHEIQEPLYETCTALVQTFTCISWEYFSHVTSRDKRWQHNLQQQYIFVKIRT